ncbi:protein YAE1 homolog [Petaurus breviceps papuanus]|uniref:protein YAE1 homolog n=1 Tax=Petaurus breviceps papuanus TaxID=3040969 RepID=UPI0036D7CA2C
MSIRTFGSACPLQRWPRSRPPLAKFSAVPKERKGGALGLAPRTPEAGRVLPGAGSGGGRVVMSWLRAACARPGQDGVADADVFDDEADETLPAQREWRNRLELRVREGYRDGVDAGKAAVLQQGFNQGYKEGAEGIISYGQLRGTLSALLSWCGLQDSSSPWITPLNDLLDAVGQCEASVLQRLTAVPSQPHVADLLDSIQDMDLCPAAPAPEKLEEERLGRPDAHLNTNCLQEASLSSGPHYPGHKTQSGACPAKPNFSWIVEQTSSIVEQLGLSTDILRNIEWPGN